MWTAGVIALTAGATLLVSAPAEAQRQPPTQEELKQRYDDKLAEGWWKNATWVTSYDAALKEAKEKHKRIFAYFTRSYSP